MPAAVGGLPAEAPARPAASAAGAYPAVNDAPPPRGPAVLTDEEQRKLEAELIAARNRANGDKPPEGDKKP